LRTKGFTLIELLVVIVIIGILVAIALPNFIKIKDKAKEAEVKQNLHSIQLAIERYATDTDGNYPYFLYGGSSLFNFGSVMGCNSGYPQFFFIQPDPQHPFDFFFQQTDTWDYADADWQQMKDQAPGLQAGFGDTLEFEGYLPKYPGNPFQQGTRAQRTFGMDALQWNLPFFACFGSDTGDKMWNLGFYGECNMLLIFFSGTGTADTIKNELPGNFAYHPRWADGTTNHGHLVTQAPYNNGSNYPGGILEPPLDRTPATTVPPVASLDVAGYDLIAVGSPRTKGQDLDNSIVDGGLHQWRTGYLTLGQERNPWTRDGDFNGTVGDYDERPFSDSVPDFYIIHLGSGLDKKIQDPTAEGS